MGKGNDGSGGRGKKKKPSVNLTEGFKAQTKKESKVKVAKIVGMSRNTLSKAQKVVATGDVQISSSNDRHEWPQATIGQESLYSHSLYVASLYLGYLLLDVQDIQCYTSGR